MQSDDPKLPSGDAREPETMTGRDNFDIRELATVEEAEANDAWLRQPEAWHMH